MSRNSHTGSIPVRRSLWMRLRPFRTAHRPFDMSTLPLDVLSEAANVARGLAIDAVHKCSSGHLGLPLGAAEIGAALFGQALNYNPADPKWLNRDRFILSAGHGSMFLYAWLHLSGYDLSLDEVKNFRQLHSKTPGHPEFGETVGVEATTGPLGQGVGNAVGYAVSAKMAAARFNTAEHAIFDHHIVALAGDGCLQEGVAYEAIAFAGHFQLDNLILIYDSNDVTLDAMAIKTQSGDVAARFVALGWDAVTVDGHDIPAFLRVYEAAKANNNGRPKIIIAKTEIARGIPEVAGTAGGHGEGVRSSPRPRARGSDCLPNTSLSPTRSSSTSRLIRRPLSRSTTPGRRPLPPGQRPTRTRPSSSPTASPRCCLRTSSI